MPVLTAPELDERTGALFGAKGTPILPTEGLAERVATFSTTAQALLQRAARAG